MKKQSDRTRRVRRDNVCVNRVRTKDEPFATDCFEHSGSTHCYVAFGDRLTEAFVGPLCTDRRCRHRDTACTTIVTPVVGCGESVPIVPAPQTLLRLRSHDQTGAFCAPIKSNFITAFRHNTIADAVSKLSLIHI